LKVGGSANPAKGEHELVGMTPVLNRNRASSGGMCISRSIV
jgi:hypothetical protein